jgi:hypothetical protein
MSNTVEALLKLEAKLKNLVSNYDFLKKENEILLQNNTKYQQEIIQQQAIILEQQSAYKLLKVAKTIEGSTKETKQKINTLIRDIDKCITALQE